MRPSRVLAPLLACFGTTDPSGQLMILLDWVAPTTVASRAEEVGGAVLDVKKVQVVNRLVACPA